MTIVAPSVLSLDYSDTKTNLAILKESNAEWLHFDVMDGHFVPNLTFGPDILKAFKASTDMVMDVHIMVDDPKFIAPIFMNAGANYVTFHYEALNNKEEIIALAKQIQSSGVKAGLSIKPKTKVEDILDLLPYFDLFLVMSVEPGFGGQKFDESALDKISKAKEYINEHKLNTLVEVDGGINEETGKRCKDAGADVLVAGSYVFKNDIKKAIDSLC